MASHSLGSSGPGACAPCDAGRKRCKPEPESHFRPQTRQAGRSEPCIMPAFPFACKYLARGGRARQLRPCVARAPPCRAQEQARQRGDDRQAGPARAECPCRHAGDHHRQPLVHVVRRAGPGRGQGDVAPPRRPRQAQARQVGGEFTSPPCPCSPTATAADAPVSGLMPAATAGAAASINAALTSATRALAAAPTTARLNAQGSASPSLSRLPDSSATAPLCQAASSIANVVALMAGTCHGPRRWRDGIAATSNALPQAHPPLPHSDTASSPSWRAGVSRRPWPWRCIRAPAAPAPASAPSPG